MFDDAFSNLLGHSGFENSGLTYDVEKKQILNYLLHSLYKVDKNKCRAWQIRDLDSRTSIGVICLKAVDRYQLEILLNVNDDFCDRNYLMEVFDAILKEVVDNTKLEQVICKVDLESAIDSQLLVDMRFRHLVSSVHYNGATSSYVLNL